MQIGADTPVFTHIEDAYNDFKREPLLPHQFSRMGPALATADINGDGRNDFFVGGAKGQLASFFLNAGNGRFSSKIPTIFEEHAGFEDVAATFADLDGDGDQDLYVVSGGNENNFQDRIYTNDGKGNFIYNPDQLPPIISSGGCVVAFDFDKDGDLDLFRGGQVNTGSYPISPVSYLLINNNGLFADVTPDFIRNIGMVSSAAAADINKDGIMDLVLAGEFMPVTILTGTGASPFFSKDHVLEIKHSAGWWNCIKFDDIDKDGDLDIVAGNHGLNSQMKPTPGQPLTIDAADFDNNGSMDAILSYYIQGKSYPIATRDEIIDQVPSLKSKFPTYKAYADATIDEIFSKEQLAKAAHFEAEEFRSGVFINNNGNFEFQPFDNEAQVFPVRDLLIDDFNGDGLKDLLLVGNNYAVRAQSGRYDAGKGLLMAQTKDAGFKPVHDSGFLADLDARKIISIDKFLIVANNNEKIQIFRAN